jgi:hypothetical protein
VKSGAHPSKYFLHRCQVEQALQMIIDDYHDEKHGIRALRIPGQSPREVFESRDRTTIQYFGDDTWHIFNTDRVKVRVTEQGIKLPDFLVPKEDRPGVYRGEVTSDLIGKDVLCWVDILDLSSIWVTDMDEKNVRLVPRATRVDPRCADTESLSAAKKECAAHMSLVKEYRRELKPSNTPADFRPVPADGITQQFAEEMRRQKAAHRESQRETASLSTAFDRLTKARNINIPKPTDPERLRRMVERLQGASGSNQ